MVEHIIVGDTKKFKHCLITVIRGDRKKAEERLEQMLNAPTENDKRLMEKHFNLRIEAVEEKDQWWNDPFLAD